MDELELIRKRKTEKMIKELKENKLIVSERMKICVPTMGNKGLDDFVSEHFGRAPTFTVVDMETNEINVFPNTSEHFGGVGAPPEILSEGGVEVMLCSGLGPKAINMFEQLGIEVYVGAGGTVRKAIRAFQSGRLHEATDADACKMHRH